MSGLLNLRAHKVIHAFASGVIIANSININLKHKDILLSLFKADLINSDLAGAIPLPVFGVAAFIGGLLSFTLPETAYKKLPDSIEEADNFSRCCMPEMSRDTFSSNVVFDNCRLRRACAASFKA